jgi:hypothetical protein
MTTDSATNTRPPHKLRELTSSELTNWIRQLERVISQTDADDPVQAEFREALEDAKTEEQSRAKIAAANGRT